MTAAFPVGSERQAAAPGGYLAELRVNRRALLAAGLGVGTSLPLFAYTNSVFAPFIIEEFGWSRAQFALVGTTMLATLPFLPLIGRATDRWGVRRVALTGTFLVPLCFVALSRMGGAFGQYLVLFALLIVLANLTSTLVYTRVVAERFRRARGLALTVVNCAPAVLAMGIVPLLNLTIETVGWRTAYVLLGAFCCVAGLVAVVTLPSDGNRPGGPAKAPRRSSARQDFREILRSGTFWIVLIGMFLCLLQTQLHSSQMSVMLLDQGLSPAASAGVISIYAFGTIVGRIACGLALDRYSTPIVTFVSLAVPVAGFVLLGSELDAYAVIAASMFLVGLSVGAESDIIAFLVAQHFDIRIYNTTLSLLYCCSFLASAAGALGLSYTVGRYGSFAPFLYVVAAATAVGSVLFLLLPRTPGPRKIGGASIDGSGS